MKVLPSSHNPIGHDLMRLRVDSDFPPLAVHAFTCRIGSTFLAFTRTSSSPPQAINLLQNTLMHR
jgi:hypothetical protein